MNQTTGDTSTLFAFYINYTDPDNDEPKVPNPQIQIDYANGTGYGGFSLEKVNAANFGGLKIFRAAVKKGSVVNSMKLHADCNCHEVCYCLSGSIEIRVQNETHRLNDDDVILFDGALDHEYTAVSEAEYLTIHLPKATRVESLLESAVT